MSASRDPSVAYLDGRLVPWEEARVPVEDRGFQFGESLYEVVPVTAGRVRLLPPHVDRMRAGAAELGLAEGVPDLEAWSRIAAELIAADGVEEGLLYAQLTGGTAPRRHWPERRPRPTFLAYVRRWRFPRDADVVRGFRAVTVPDLRWGRCDLKTTQLLGSVLALRAAARAGAEEAIFVAEDGTVREGAVSNVFLVEDGRLVTPEQTHHLLPGVTRPVIAEIARAAGMEVVSRRVDAAELATAR
ncbi:MAG: D-amino acid aminotransferase, partial [Nitrospirae bacterium]